MADLMSTLPEEIEIGAVKRTNWNTEVITTDGGREVRNALWDEPLVTYECSIPTSTRDGAVYQAVVALYEEAMGKLFTFGFVDWTDETGSTTVTVRFDSDLQITGVAGHIDHIDTFTLLQVRDDTDS